MRNTTDRGRQKQYTTQFRYVLARFSSVYLLLLCAGISDIAATVPGSTNSTGKNSTKIPESPWFPYVGLHGGISPAAMPQAKTLVPASLQTLQPADFGKIIDVGIFFEVFGMIESLSQLAFFVECNFQQAKGTLSSEGHPNAIATSLFGFDISAGTAWRFFTWHGFSLLASGSLGHYSANARLDYSQLPVSPFDPTTGSFGSVSTVSFAAPAGTFGTRLAYALTSGISIELRARYRQLFFSDTSVGTVFTNLGVVFSL